MIRVAKNSAAPLSLSTTSAYDGEDVKIALRNDHFEKCYICERHLVTDFQIEHLKSQKNHPALTQDWNNLFHSCGYCNGKKLNNYDHIIDPATNNVEQQIKQEIDSRKYRNKIPASRYLIGKRGVFYFHKSGYVIMTN